MSDDPTTPAPLHNDVFDTHRFDDAPRTPRRAGALVVWALMAALLFAAFFALGTWQLQRRVWKLDLIERVEQRAHATPVAAPGPAQWPGVRAQEDEYRRIQATGTYLYGKDTYVRASTALGSGYWVLRPFQLKEGGILLINLGFVPSDWDTTQASQAPSDNAETTVTGLLRVSEPGGGFLQNNVPAGNRWYSRDVRAIGMARGLVPVAPYFLDADGAPPAPEATERVWPAGGMTVTRFTNNHLVYAITWYTLAIMVLIAVVLFARDESRLRRNARSED